MLVAGFNALGTVPGWITVAGIAILTVILWRGQAGPALGYLSEANRILERELGELKRKDAEKEHLIAELRSRTDITVAQAPIVESLKRLEQENAKRTDQILNVLDIIAGRLGPEPNGH